MVKIYGAKPKSMIQKMGWDKVKVFEIESKCMGQSVVYGSCDSQKLRTLQSY